VELFQQASQHYTTFVLGIFTLTAVLTVRNILNDDSRGFKFYFRLCLFGLASIVCIIIGIYLRYHAIRLETIQPFITDLTTMISAAIIYFFYGHLLTSPLLQHSEFSTSFSMSYMGMDTTGGMFWFVPLAADKIFFLIIFAALLIGIGMLPLVIELGKWMGRRIKGGAAFPAIVGSAMTGSVMGQAVSNTMLTGQLTIPMMKKHGFNREFAGAIEAVASTSGQLLPPILGMAAFIIAAFLNIAYIQVALCATLPAFLYVAGVIIAVLLAARVYNLGYLREHVNTAIIYRLLPTFVGSFSIVLVLLLRYYSPSIAALSGITVMFALSIFQGKVYRPSLKTVKEGFRNGLEVCTVLCLLLLAIGPLAQMATTTNIAGKLGGLLSKELPHNLPLLLAGTMIVSLILGMGLPTPVAYLVVALTLTPFLQELGVPALYAHMFVFYFAIFSTISPPVAISCLAASKISGGTFFGTARESLKIAMPTFIIPFAFIFNPALLTFPKVSAASLIAFLLTTITMLFASIAFYGFFLRKLNTIERTSFGISAILVLLYLIMHVSYLLPISLGLGALGILWILIGRFRIAPDKVKRAEKLAG
jgi:TRAP transporter 4TM/12TM fusion protein